MKPPKFQYYDPSTIEEALDLLKRHGDDAMVLAGGQSLMPLLNFRLIHPDVLVDINRIQSLDYIVRDPNGGLRIGALTRQRAVECHPKLADWQPLLREAMPLIGNLQIRNRGTVGGSVAHGDPAAELPAVLLTLNGELVIRSTATKRVASADDFNVTYMTTDLAADELLCEIRLPPWRPGDGWAICEVPRHAGGSAIVGVAARLSLDQSGVCTGTSICLFGVAPTPVLRQSAAAALIGLKVTAGAIDRAAQLAADRIEPGSDMHASAEYRRQAAAVLTRRALLQAWRRAARET